MPKCIECEKTFDVEDARKEYDDEFQGDPDFYDESFDENFCGSCATAQTYGLISQGNHVIALSADPNYEDDLDYLDYEGRDYDW